MKDIIKNYGIIGVISNYKSTLKISGRVTDLEIKDINSALKIVGLGENILDKELSSLTISELWKVDLATKLDNNIIIIGNMSDLLIYKDREYMKKLFMKLNNDYKKNIIIIDDNIDSFINVTKRVFVIKNKDVIYETSSFYDDELYKYVKMPKLIEFIKYVNKDKKILENHLDIYELIKDIYRVVS